MALKHLVLALAVAAACAVAPSSPRGSTEAVGDTFEMGKAVAMNDATLAVNVTPKLRGASEGHRPAGRGLDFAYYQTDEPTAEPTKVPTAEPSKSPTLQPTDDPTAAPSKSPTLKPTAEPTAEPSSKPTTAEPTAEPTAGPTVTPAPTAEPTVTLAPTLPVGGPAAAACLAAPGGDCESCCGGCTRKTPEVDGLDFRNEGQCVCFEGALYGTRFNKRFVTLTDSNDCAKARGSYMVIKARARRPSARAIVHDGGILRRAARALTRLLSTATTTSSAFAPRPPSPLLPPQFLPQGQQGNDELTAIGDDNELYVCPAFSLPTALDLFLPQGDCDRRECSCPSGGEAPGNDVITVGGDGDDLLSATGNGQYAMEVCPASSLPPPSTWFHPQGDRGYDTCRRRRSPQDPWRYTDGYVEDDDVVVESCEFGFTP